MASASGLSPARGVVGWPGYPVYGPPAANPGPYPDNSSHGAYPGYQYHTYPGYSGYSYPVPGLPPQTYAHPPPPAPPRSINGQGPPAQPKQGSNDSPPPHRHAAARVSVKKGPQDKLRAALPPKNQALTSSSSGQSATITVKQNKSEGISPTPGGRAKPDCVVDSASGDGTANDGQPGSGGTKRAPAVWLKLKRKSRTSQR